MARHKGVKPSEKHLREQVEQDVRYLATADLAEGAEQLLETLGYKSKRTFQGSPTDPSAFLNLWPTKIRDTKSEQEFRDKVSEVKLLFQVVDDDIRRAADTQTEMFQQANAAADAKTIQSFIFAVLELKGETYPRGVYARVAREVNKRMPIATVLMMRTPTRKVSLAFVDRRKHKRLEDRAVLGNVALLREIDTEDPHRAHLDILCDLVIRNRLDWIRANQPSYDFNFTGLLAAWLDVLNTEELNKCFYEGLYKWYQRAINEARFPTEHEPVEEQVIRLITRLMFIWFIKEKGFVARELFNQRQVKSMLKGYDAERGDSYYRCVLQNLFFGTLNTPVDHRTTVSGGAVPADIDDATNLLHIDEIDDLHGLVESLHETPYINGGLFDCLDRKDEATGELLHMDCYISGKDRSKYLSVPNKLFFDADGIVTHFNKFKFTVEENTTREQEVALDPELLGNVFESLLATYITVREGGKVREGDTTKSQTGSYYTPRVVVEMMTAEALADSLIQRLSTLRPSWTEQRDEVLGLFDHSVPSHHFDRSQCREVVDAIAETKLLDPAVGSGAFPMAALQQMTLALRKLDPDNKLWEAHQRRRALSRESIALEAESLSLRQQLHDQVIEVFETYRDADYGRKLFLIQHCIFGVDIQPIAVQITRLRFFISLAIEQQRREGEVNFGVQALPNLETRFVAADTLMPLEAKKQPTLADDESLQDLISRITDNRERYFREDYPEDKEDLRRTDRGLRRQLSDWLRNEGMPEQAADRLADWDPFNPSTSAGWFDPEYMFGIQSGFDVLIGNPPYKQIPKRYYPESRFPFSEGLDKGKQNLYKLFVEAGYSLAAKGGVLSMIVQSSLMCDVSASGTRQLLLTNGALRKVIEFPERPPRRENQLFMGVTQGTCVFSFVKRPYKETKLLISIRNDRATINNLIFNEIPNDTILKNWPEHKYLPLIDPIAGDVLARISNQRNVVPLNRLVSKFNQGDLNLTSDRTNFSTTQTDTFLLRGDHVGRQYIRYDKIDEFCATDFRKDRVQENLANQVLVCRQVTGATNWRRLTFALLDGQAPKLLVGNSVNKFILRDQSQSQAYLGLLNSRLLDWMFRLTSTNNHVNIYQLEELRVPMLSAETSDELSRLTFRAVVARRRALLGEAELVESEIDDIVYDLYGITAAEREVIEAAVR